MSNFVCIILYYLFKGRPKLYKLHAAQKSVSCPTWPCFCISVIEPAYYHFCCWKRKWIEGPGISLVPTREGQETLYAIFLEQKKNISRKVFRFSGLTDVVQKVLHMESKYLYYFRPACY